VVLSGVLHWKKFRERAPETRQQPVSIVFNLPLGRVAFVYKIGEDLNDYILGQAMEMKLSRMLRPMAAPVIIEINLQSLVLLIYAIGEQLLDTRVFGVGDVRPNVEKEAAVTKGCGVTTMVGIFVVHHGSDALGMEAVGGAETCHPGA
jgi:hypothetical protein